VRSDSGLPGRPTPITFTATTFLRSFHQSVLHRSNCDFMSPCNCPRCMEDNRTDNCQVCEVNPTAHQEARWVQDDDFIWSYEFTCFCEQCWEEKDEKRAEKQRKEYEFMQELEKKYPSRSQRVKSMLEQVKQLHHGEEQAPIAYAIQKLMDAAKGVREEYSRKGVREYSLHSQQWFHRLLRERLSNELCITKVRGRYLCDKQRVDAMDFKEWYMETRRL
ncbi:hypothetical protein B0T21DRAFT_294714, partial [Apiosordaria backusii]